MRCPSPSLRWFTNLGCYVSVTLLGISGRRRILGHRSQQHGSHGELTERSIASGCEFFAMPPLYATCRSS
jgi:hypothetical protein